MEANAGLVSLLQEKGLSAFLQDVAQAMFYAAHSVPSTDLEHVKLMGAEKALRELSRLGADFLVNVSPNHWDKWFSGANPLDTCKASDLERSADGLASQAALLGGYLGLRGGAGAGDHGHDKALTHGRKREKRVRAALGYTYP
jgi:hypothetical protein